MTRRGILRSTHTYTARHGEVSHFAVPMPQPSPNSVTPHQYCPPYQATTGQLQEVFGHSPSGSLLWLIILPAYVTLFLEPAPGIWHAVMSANKRIVLIGGGHAHVHVIKSYSEQPLRSRIESNGISLILITNTLHTPYSGMLPGFVSGHYTYSDIHIDLQRLCDYGGFTLIHDSAIGVTYNDEDGDGGGGGRVQLENGEPIPYDVLSIDVGSSPGGGLPNYEDTEDDTPAAIPVKPISTFCTRYDELKSRLRESAKVYTKANPFVLLVVGGGADS